MIFSKSEGRDTLLESWWTVTITFFIVRSATTQTALWSVRRASEAPRADIRTQDGRSRGRCTTHSSVSRKSCFNSQIPWFDCTQIYLFGFIEEKCDIKDMYCPLPHHSTWQVGSFVYLKQLFSYLKSHTWVADIKCPKNHAIVIINYKHKCSNTFLYTVTTS